MHVTAANEQERSQVSAVGGQVQQVTGDTVELAFVDQGYTGAPAAQDAAAYHMQLEVVKLPEAKKGLCCCPAVGGGTE